MVFIILILIKLENVPIVFRPGSNQWFPWNMDSIDKGSKGLTCVGQ